MANDFLTFATSGAANVYTNAEYAADTDQQNGNQPGIAKSKLVNKAIRQSSIISAVTAQLISDLAGIDAVDDGTTATLLNGFKSIFNAKAPLDSPALTGVPTAPTAPQGTDTDQIATTKFVNLSVYASNSFTKPTSGVPLFEKVNAYSISIPVGTSVSVGTALVTVTGSAYTLSLNTTGVGGLDTGTKTAGTDYSVYALTTGEWIVSASKTAPSGYTTANSRRVGGFHYGVIPEAFTAINNITSADATKIAGINSYSFWDLKFRPICDPSGMVHIFGRWYDIYLCNTDHHTYGTSAAGKTIAGGVVSNGRNYPKIPLFYGGNGTVTYGSFTWFEAAEIGKAYSKDLISYDEFVGIAYGVLEATSAGAADTGITQHLANYTSKFGICMATGCQWIWGKNVQGIGGTSWLTGVTEGRGDIYAPANTPTAAVFGGGRDSTSYSGSRASRWYNYVWDSLWHLGCRFACDHLELA